MLLLYIEVIQNMGFDPDYNYLIWWIKQSVKPNFILIQYTSTFPPSANPVSVRAWFPENVMRGLFLSVFYAGTNDVQTLRLYNRISNFTDMSLSW